MIDVVKGVAAHDAYDACIRGHFCQTFVAGAFPVVDLVVGVVIDVFVLVLKDLHGVCPFWHFRFIEDSVQNCFWLYL